MTTEHESDSARRKRRTLQERIADLDRERAELQAKKDEMEKETNEKRVRVVKAAMEKAAADLDEIVRSSFDIGPLRDECKGLAVRLRSWA